MILQESQYRREANYMNRLSIYLLALGAFVLGVTEYVVAGTLDIIAQDLNISISLAGQLITIYALAFAFGSFILVILTAKFDRKKVLLLSLVIFISGNIIAFVSYQFELLMVSRIVLAMSGGLYTVVASNFAAKLAAPGKQGAAIATIITGFSVALVLGVPIGTFSATYMDWHYIYLYIAIISLVLMTIMNKLIPTMKGQVTLPLKEQFRLIKDKRIISGLLTTLFWILGYTVIFAYISPLLRASTGVSTEVLSTILLLLGLFALLGSKFGGYAVDRWGPVRAISTSLVVHILASIILTFTISSIWSATITIMVWSFAVWATTAANQAYLISLRPEVSEFILSFNSASLNIGITLGAAMGGLVIKQTQMIHLAWIGGLVALIALVTASYSFIPNRANTEADYL
jgi:DHA1 family putative efflux transporter-like MFS transporter